MMGLGQVAQGALFYEVSIEDHLPRDHILRAIARMTRHAIPCKLRKKVEMLFAHLERILKLVRLRLRGPSGARDEFHFAATAQNLGKRVKVLPPPQAGHPA